MVLASLAIVLALVAAYARQAAVNSDQFANRATVALRDDSVRSLIAQKVTDEVILKNQADLIAARPIIESVAADVVGGRAFTNLFRKAVRDVHRALFQRDRTPSPSRHRYRDGARGGAGAGAPGTRPRAQLDRTGGAGRAEHRQSERDARRHRRTRSAARARAPLPLARVRRRRPAARTRDRRETVVELGVGAAVVGVLLLVAYAVAPLDRARARRGPRGAGCSGGGLGRFPRRPSQRGLDTGRLRSGGGGRGGLVDQAARVWSAAARGRGLAGDRAPAPRVPRAPWSGLSWQPGWWCSSSATP